MTPATPGAPRKSWLDRLFWVRIHRYAGLSMALFLAVAGLTGSLLAFNHEIDAWLNPQLFHAPAHGQAQSFDALVARIEQSDARLEVEYLSFDGVPGHSALAFVYPRAGQPGPGYDQVFLDPVSGAILGTRSRTACCLEPENLMAFVLEVHRGLYLPGRWGIWFMGGIAIIWLFDCFIGFYLTLPRGRPLLQKWQPAWQIKPGAGTFRLNYDLHRAAGLWLWLLLLGLALSSVYLNLKNEVFKPVVSVFSPLRPFPTGDSVAPPGAASLGFEAIRNMADAEARLRGWDARASGVTYVRSNQVYIALLWPSHTDRGTGLGKPILYYDAYSGKLLDTLVAGEGTAGEVFTQVQFPVHSGQLAGLPGRIVIALSGLAVVLLSVTGIYIWWKKRRSHSVGARRPVRAANA